jgi:hypothetical protein
MTDLFTSLRRTDDWAELDPTFSAELLTEARRRLADTTPYTDGWVDGALIPLDSDETPGRQPRRAVWILLAAAVVVIAVAGIALATNNNKHQSPAPVATVSVAPTTTVATETVRYVVATANDIPVTFTVPKSWGYLGGWVWSTLIETNKLTNNAVEVQFAGVTNIYSYSDYSYGQNGCRYTLLDPPVGPTVDDLVTAWANVPELDATTPVEITVDGYTGKQIEFTVPDFAPCIPDFNWFGIWHWAPPNTLIDNTMFPSNKSVSPKKHFRMLVLDVDGTRLLIAASTYPDAPPQDRAALEELLASIQIG